MSYYVPPLAAIHAYIDKYHPTPIPFNFINTASTHIPPTTPIPLSHSSYQTINPVEHVDWINQQHLNFLHHKYTACLSAFPGSPLPSPQKSSAWTNKWAPRWERNVSYFIPPMEKGVQRIEPPVSRMVQRVEDRLPLEKMAKSVDKGIRSGIARFNGENKP
ncbi:hypothetical protein FVER53590_09456 [Fusarium verticillioides]|nr:hypothetical protein FVER53590_09456 [Fusarium verticillioides]